jgi:hypothetical protein
MHGGGERRGVYRVLVGRPKGKRPLTRPRCSWEDNVWLNLWKIGIDGVNWIHLAQDMVQCLACVSMVMNLGFHKESSRFIDKLSGNQLFK